MDKILCVCERGNVRSVTTAAILKDFLGLQDVVAVGAQTTSSETMTMLCAWANLILVVGTSEIRAALPEAALRNTIVLEIGDDSWGQAMHPELVDRIIEALYQKTGLLQAQTSPYYPDLASYMTAAALQFDKAADYVLNKRTDRWNNLWEQA